MDNKHKCDTCAKNTGNGFAYCRCSYMEKTKKVDECDKYVDKRVKVTPKKVDLLEVKESATKVNSWDITIDMWINAMRIEGKRVQIFTTTI